MTDRELQDALRAALRRDPGIDAREIAVSVKGGVVTLKGDVKGYRQEAAAERLAFGLRGVRAVANDVNTYTWDAHPTDTEIAAAALSALPRRVDASNRAIAVSVSDGWVTLSGVVDSHAERVAAAHAAQELPGVRGVTDNLT